MLTIALNILDIAGNCFEAGADDVSIMLDTRGEQFICLTIEDNGRGMNTETLEKVSDPFFTTRKTRKVGLGIPLIRQQAEATGGRFKIDSEKGKGTTVFITFGKDHPDRQPLGDIAGVVVMLAGRDPNVRIRFTCHAPEGTFVFDSKEIMETLEIKAIDDKELIDQLKELIENNLQKIGFDTLN